MGVVVGTIVGLVFIIVGIFLIFNKSKRTGSTQGTIQSIPNCTQHIDNDSGTMYACTNMNVKYTVNKTDYITPVSVDSIYNYKNGSNIKIYFDPKDPKHGTTSSDNYHVVGWFGLIFGIILLGSSWFWLWMTTKYKFVAAAEGVAGVVGMINGSF